MSCADPEAVAVWASTVSSARSLIWSEFSEGRSSPCAAAPVEALAGTAPLLGTGGCRPATRGSGKAGSTKAGAPNEKQLSCELWTTTMESFNGEDGGGGVDILTTIELALDAVRASGGVEELRGRLHSSGGRRGERLFLRRLGAARSLGASARSSPAMSCESPVC